MHNCEFGVQKYFEFGVLGFGAEKSKWHHGDHASFHGFNTGITLGGCRETLAMVGTGNIGVRSLLVLKAQAFVAEGVCYRTQKDYACCY